MGGLAGRGWRGGVGLWCGRGLRAEGRGLCACVRLYISPHLLGTTSIYTRQSTQNLKSHGEIRPGFFFFSFFLLDRSVRGQRAGDTTVDAALIWVSVARAGRRFHSRPPFVLPDLAAARILSTLLPLLEASPINPTRSSPPAV